MGVGALHPLFPSFFQSFSSRPFALDGFLTFPLPSLRSFLFLTRPFPPSDPRLGLAVKTFPPTFRNTYFAHASPPSSTSSSSSDAEGFLAFGGGNDGVFGLWIDGKLERGWTGRSETYANEALVKREGEDKDGKGKFEVVGLECWAVGT